jgi:hypothetical protein
MQMQWFVIIRKLMKTTRFDFLEKFQPSGMKQNFESRTGSIGCCEEKNNGWWVGVTKFTRFGKSFEFFEMGMESGNLSG